MSGQEVMDGAREELMRLFMAAEQQKPALQSSVNPACRHPLSTAPITVAVPNVKRDSLHACHTTCCACKATATRWALNNTHARDGTTINRQQVTLFPFACETVRGGWRVTALGSVSQVHAYLQAQLTYHDQCVSSADKALSSISLQP